MWHFFKALKRNVARFPKGRFLCVFDDFFCRNRQIWDSLFFDFHGLLCRLLPLDAQENWLGPSGGFHLTLVTFVVFFGGGWKNYPVMWGIFRHKRHKHVTKPWNKDPGTWANQDGSCHVSGFVSSWWTCFLEVFVPLGRYNEKALGYVVFCGVDFVNPYYCEHEIQLTIWKTAVAVNFHELAPKASNPVQKCG